MNASTEPPITVLLAGDPQTTQSWYQTFLADARFTVMMSVPNGAMLKAALEHGGADVVIMQDGILPGQELLAAVASIPSCTYVLLSRPNDELRRLLKEQPTVREVFPPGFRMAEGLNAMYAAATAKRSQAPTVADDWQRKATERTTLPQSVRIITVWNQCGGAGCSTVASNLAWECARRGYQTLLINLAAPDSSPLFFPDSDLRKNMTAWISNPVPGALTNAIQKIGPLSILAGFPDVISQGRALEAGTESANYLTKLFYQATMMGFGSIIIDTQHSLMEAIALASSNTLVLVARPTLADAYCSHRAFTVVRKTMAGQHAINARSGVHVVLNRTRTGGMGSGEWIRNVRELETEANAVAFPDVSAQIPDNPEVEFAQNSGQMPLMMVEGFAKPLVALADRLWGEKKTYQDTSGKRINLGWLSGRVK
ncbi:MAG: hypothetical protein WBM17_17570 [Anaerolineales bacterium]